MNKVYIKQIRIDEEEKSFLDSKENASEFIRILIHREMENEISNRIDCNDGNADSR